MKEPRHLLFFLKVKPQFSTVSQGLSLGLSLFGLSHCRLSVLLCIWFLFGWNTLRE